jgi:hypothetical protein
MNKCNNVESFWGGDAAAAAETVRYLGAAWSLSFVCLIQLKLLLQTIL